jgi:hypothetical protein
MTDVQFLVPLNWKTQFATSPQSSQRSHSPPVGGFGGQKIRKGRKEELTQSDTEKHRGTQRNVRGVRCEA